jgi:hypothetical protein
MLKFQEVNEQLAGMKMKLRQKHNWQQSLEQLNLELKQEMRKRDHCEKQWRDEQQDVDRLTRLSLGALVYSLIGKKEEKLSKENEEVLLAKLKYDEVIETIHDFEEEIKVLNRQLADVRTIEADIEDLIQQKRRMIQFHYPELAYQIQQLDDREPELAANKIQIEEAIAAGDTVLRKLDHAQELLESAKGWGTWDMLGGGVISTAIKHDRIDEARSAIHAAQRSLRHFEKELKDVQKDVSIRIEISGLLTFADFFFDGFITDWIVEGRISDALHQIDERYSLIQRVVSDLKAENRSIQSELYDLRHKVLNLIENAQ